MDRNAEESIAEHYFPKGEFRLLSPYFLKVAQVVADPKTELLFAIYKTFPGTGSPLKIAPLDYCDEDYTLCVMYIMVQNVRKVKTFPMFIELLEDYK